MVTIRCPKATANDAQLAAVTPTELALLPTLKILVVDDLKANQIVAQRILEQIRQQVTLASSGGEAIELLDNENTHFDLVLMDIEMPELDGIETLRRLQERGNVVPIIAASAHTGLRDEQRFQSLGFAGSIGKPLSIEALTKVLTLIESKSQTFVSADLKAVKIPKVKTFDSATLLSRMGEDLEIAQEVVSEFLNELPLLIAQAKQSLDEGDQEAIRKSMHSLKGGFINAGGGQASILCSGLEALAKKGDIAECIDAWRLAIRAAGEYEDAAHAWLARTSQTVSEVDMETAFAQE